MDLELSDKVAFISGSSHGIGLEIAKTLHAEGCKVVLNGRNKKNLDHVSKEIPNAITISADITDEKESDRVIAEILDKLGKLDILICNVDHIVSFERFSWGGSHF